jgi:5-methylcytosine-specific restriction endonuclease McrA
MRNVLVLSNAGEIHDVIGWQDAFTLVCREAVRIQEYFDDVEIRSASQSHKLPSILVLKNKHYIPFSQRLAVNKANVLMRDEFTCQYCGKHLTSTTGTIDHVLPTSRGGQHDWRNVVAACKACNGKKDDRTPKEAGMSLKRKPFTPTRDLFYHNYIKKPEYACWIPYFNV